ncbi:MAG: polyprenyl synthetase family protein [Lachnospiraceae bacterium]|nr:polyprenyl synthetase family protein [Lachnospiraceae bacterium]
MTMKEDIAIRARQIDEIIMRMMPDITGPQKTIYEVMEYTMRAGGKRLRPMLMLETYKMFGGTSKVIEPFMAAIEMIHTYSLIHDDLPCMDDDDYRRGKKTAHVVYGEAMALLAGDALLNYAFETASNAFTYEEHLKDAAKALKILAKKAGVFGMLGGQVVDVEMEGQPLSLDEIEFIHKKKTAALIEASMMIGAILAGASEEQVQTIKEISRKVGVAFQIQDDILDVIGSEEELGKPIGSDEKNQKTTYVSLMGIDQAKAEVEELSEEAKSQLSLFIGEDKFLMDLITYLIDRDN